jgi:hypothetical protein
MYDEQLEKLIEIGIKDGVLSETERKVIVNKAIKLGVDEDEIIMVLEDRLEERKKILNFQEPPKPSTAAKKCPACGSIRIPGAKNCADCGYEFMSPLQELINDLNEAQKLANLEISRKAQSKQAEGDFISNFKSKLNKKGILGAAVETLLGSGMWDGEGDEESESYELIQRYQAPIIEGFPIPSDPDDLLEAMEYFNSEIEGADDYGPWERKQKQMIASAKRVFANDRSILKQINSYEENI